MKIVELPKWMWYGTFNGFAAYKYIFIKKDMIELEKSYVIMHEYKHCLDWQKEGFFKFIFSYARETINKGYYDNKYEVSARFYGLKHRSEYKEMVI